MAERIIIKSDRQVELMRKAGRLTAQARAYGASLVRPGITTKELDHAMFEFITKHGGYPSFLHLYGFPGNRVSDISRAVQNYVESNGFSVVREYVGHGVGAHMHEAPEVPNYVTKRRLGGDPRLVKNMTIAVEPMVNMGGPAIKQLDQWTVLTADGQYAAHYENTILITDGAPEVLTTCGD